MMKTFILAVAVLVVAVDACCTPDQWEGVSATVTGSVAMGMGSITESASDISYDFMNKMLRYTAKTSGSPGINITIVNYNTKEMFTFDNNMESCKITPVDMDMTEACIPPNARETGQFYYGAGMNELHALSYHVTMPVGEGEIVTAEVSVTDMDCVPIGEVVYGRVGMVDMMTSTGFVDITPGIKDPSVFDPPAVCTQIKGDPLKQDRKNFVGIPTF